MSVAPPSVLYVEDDPVCRDTVAAFLGMHELSVRTAVDAYLALVALSAATPDVLLMGLAMPGFTGPDFLRLIRTDPRWRELPVIVLTARSETGSVLVDLGVREVLLKSATSQRQILEACLRACHRGSVASSRAA